MLYAQGHDVLEVAYAAVRIALAQPGVEGAVAVAGVVAAVVERAVQRQHAARGQVGAGQREQLLHQRPGHDVRGVGAEHDVEGAVGPVAAGQVEQQRRAQVGRRVRGMPGAYAGVVLGQVAGLPDEVRQARREVHAVLARARADLQHLAAVGKGLPQHGDGATR